MQQSVQTFLIALSHNSLGSSKNIYCNLDKGFAYFGDNTTLTFHKIEKQQTNDLDFNLR